MTTVAERVRSAGNIPIAPTTFVGRRRELGEVKRLLSAGRLLTLTGFGGVGKTRLALQSAASVRRAFPNGVWLVELAALTEPELLPQTVGATIGLFDESSAPSDRLAEFLADRRLLLVMDNCEHVVDACADLVHKLLVAAPGVKILATSRERLGVDGEQIMPVPPLPVPEPGEQGDADDNDALALFVERAASSVPGFELTDDNRDTVARICRRLDGVPLAIELAAVWLRTLSVDQVLARLDDRFALLSRGRREALPRQRTLRAATDWSFDLCSPSEQVLWGRLSVFSGGFVFDAVEEVCSGPDLPREDVLDAISGLVDKSILIRDEQAPGVRSRYHMLETIHEYGRERLVASGDADAIGARHRDYFRKLTLRSVVEGFGPRQEDWLVLLRDERANLRAAMEFSFGAGDVDAALEIAGHPHYWFAAGYVREGAGWLDRGLSMVAEPSVAVVNALWARAFLGVLRGERENLESLLSRCRDLAERLGETELFLPLVDQCAGLAAFDRGDLDEARTLSERALSAMLAMGRLQGAFDCLWQLALTEYELDDQDAGATGERCLALCDEHGARWSKSYALWLVGVQCWRKGDPHRSIRLLRESIEMRSAVDDRHGLTLCVEVLAWCAASLRHWYLAAQLMGAAAGVWRLSGAVGTGPSILRFAHRDVKAKVKAELGAAFAQARKEGASCTLEQAVALALSERTGTAQSGTGQPGTGQPGTGRTRQEEAGAGPGGDVAWTTDQGLDTLTPREREIAGLVASGMTNKDIAAKLVISPRTAESHVEHILTKLGFNSRAQIATWVVQRQSEQP